ncbi:MAG: ABC transporter permease [bacterium]
MNIQQSTLIGLNGLTVHKLRSILTALGIIFGVAAVIAMLSIGEGARLEALEQIQMMGVNNIIIRSKEVTSQSFEKAKANFSPGLTAYDGSAIKEICSFIETMVPQWEKTVPAMYLHNRLDVRLIGTTTNFLQVFNYQLRNGNFFQQTHLDNQANVCVLGNDAKDQLFHFENPIGKQLKLDQQWFTVIGVMERQLNPKKKVENLKIRNLNLDIYIPLTTGQNKIMRTKGSGQYSLFRFSGPGGMSISRDLTFIPKQQLEQLTIKVKHDFEIGEAYRVIEHILARRHFGVSDYEIIVPEMLVQQSQQTQRIFNIVMGAIAGISLLVGGIGIMNIMLASVLERTKEIGIRRAVGATRYDVLGQFLFEALFLSIVGGIIGIGLGYSLTKIITYYAEWRTIVSYSSIILAFGVSAAVGVGFGYYPARTAAYQNPIESLRYE